MEYQPESERILPPSSAASELRFHIEREEAWSLALLLKRLTWDEIRRCSQDDSEAYVICAAIHRVQSALNDVGVCPR